MSNQLLPVLVSEAQKAGVALHLTRWDLGLESPARIVIELTEWAYSSSWGPFSVNFNGTLNDTLSVSNGAVVSSLVAEGDWVLDRLVTSSTGTSI
jgi:hypothetical protein